MANRYSLPPSPVPSPRERRAVAAWTVFRQRWHGYVLHSSSGKYRTPAQCHQGLQAQFEAQDCGGRVKKKTFWEGLSFGKPFWVFLFHGERFHFFPTAQAGRAAGCPAPGSACLFCFLTLATLASIPLEYSERKISARRCLLWVFL